MYYHDGLARTQTWVANQPPVMTPPPTTKTPFSEWTGATDSSTFDRRTLGGYSAGMPPRPPRDDARVCGIKRNAFLGVLAVGLFLLVVAVAVGLGVGLGTRRSSGTVAVDAAAADLGCVCDFLIVLLASLWRFDYPELLLLFSYSFCCHFWPDFVLFSTCFELVYKPITPLVVG